MTAPILYCGDTDLNSAAGYLAGLMAYWDWPFKYVPSDQPLSAAEVDNRRLIVLSDFPAANVASTIQDEIVQKVQAGTGLLMIGGWESFHGLGGDWDATTLADVLPVEMQSTDDRLNCDHPVLLRSVTEHDVTRKLPWESRPPHVGGFNRFTAKADATVLLEGDRVQLRPSAAQWGTKVLETHPMLVVGTHGNGRTAALATDVAPHWVGGLVDWGDGRVTGQAAGAEAIEVGDLYAQLFHQLLTWVAGGAIE